MSGNPFWSLGSYAGYLKKSYTSGQNDREVFINIIAKLPNLQ